MFHGFRFFYFRVWIYYIICGSGKKSEKRDRKEKGNVKDGEGEKTTKKILLSRVH